VFPGLHRSFAALRMTNFRQVFKTDLTHDSDPQTFQTCWFFFKVYFQP
jgi:hypothetical protein